jgi:hypothetical protein
MKTLTKTSVLLLVALLAWNCSLAAKNAEYTREIKKEFQVNPEAKLVLENKYGDIRILNSDENKVSIEVLITADARDLESAVKIFEKVKIQFSNTPDLVEARTQIEDNLNVRGQFSIDYTVTMPVAMSLDADNKFGDLIAGEIGGKAKIKVAYGNLEVNRLSNSDNLVEVRFGKGGIDWIKGAVMILKYSDFEGEYAGSINLNSQYSNFRSGKVIALDATFEGGNLDLGSTSLLTCRAKFSDISIRSLDQKLDLTNNYGSFELDEIPAGFTSITVTNSYGNIALGIASAAAFNLEADMHYCNLEFDQAKANLNYFNDSGHDQQIRGSVGVNPSGSVKVNSNYGNVSLEN